MTTLAGIRSSLFAPVLLGHHVPRGVLADFGLAAWEMPETTNGAGQLAWLHATDLDTFDEDFLGDIRFAPTIANKEFLAELRRATLEIPEALMNLAELSSGGYPGTSLCLQNLYAGFSRSALGVDSVYDFRPDVQGILAQWTGGKRLWINCGLGNTPEFVAGELRFNTRYSMLGRASQNTFRPYINFSGPLGVTPETIVYVTDLAGSDGLTRQWPHTVYDGTLPEVVELCRQHLVAMATALGDSVQWIVEGEHAPWLANNQTPLRGDCATKPLVELCGPCEPLGPWSEHHTEGFVAWLQGYLGLADIEDVNDRWGTSLASFAQITPHVAPFCATASKAVEDYRAFLGYLVDEASLLHCHEIRRTAPTAIVTPLKFGERGIEKGALSGDVPCVGNWEGFTQDHYLEARAFFLHAIANAARLTGAGPVFHVSSPCFNSLSPNWAGGPDVPFILRTRRSYTDAHTGWFLREVLTASAAHVGYRKSPGGDGVEHLESSKQAIFDLIDRVTTAHPTQLAACGAWQRLAIHCESTEAINLPGYHNAGARTTFHLAKLWRDEHRPVAIFSSPRWFDRPQARWQIERSLVVVPYHSEVETLVETYRTLFPDNAPGAALLIRESYTGTLPAWVNPTPFAGSNLYRVRTSGGSPVDTNVFLLQVPPPRPCLGDGAFAELASLVESLRPAIEAEITGTFVSRPVTVTTANPAHAADLQTNVVTDGVDWTVAVSNMNPAAERTVTLAVAPEIAAALDVTYTPATVTLGAGLTELVTLQATATGVNVAAAITTVQANLDALGLDGYDARGITAASDLLTQATSLLPTHPGRALAALGAAARMVQVRLAFAAGTITVDVRRPGMPTEAASLAVTGAECRLVWHLNGGEEGAESTTDGSGVATITVGAPATQRWDFDANNLAAPPSYANDAAEVYVTDPTTGATSCARIDLT